MTTTPAALALSAITKRFAGAPALEDVSLTVRASSVHALLGENGAGKTTLMRIAFGVLGADAGEIHVAGVPVTLRSPAAAIALGLGMVHQHFTNVGSMTVAENVALGGRGRFNAADAARVVRDVGQRAGLILDPNARAEDLPVEAQQRLEIVKALAHGARVLILDEPTAVLAPTESQALLTWVRGFADRGAAVVLITHKLGEALSIADDVTVLRQGRRVLSAVAASVTANTLATAMVGDVPPRPHRRVVAPGDAVVRANALTLTRSNGLVAVREATFDLRAGEVVGIAAVEGSGQRELVHALAGRTRPASGSLSLPSRIGYVPADRQREALILPFTLTENVQLGSAGSARGRIDWPAVRARTAALVRAHDIRGGAARSEVWTLSGGNQQKLVLARELEEAPALVVADNPTRGLDIRAAAAVHDRLRGAAESGATVVVYSSDLDEVISLASRVLTIHAGRLQETPPRRDIVARAMLGLE